MITDNGLMSCPEVEQGFRRVDRKHFVPKVCPQNENEKVL